MGVNATLGGPSTIDAACGRPRILIIDDLFGRETVGGYNPDRARLCGQLLLVDVTPGSEESSASSRIKKPLADAVFCRGQRPACATVGDRVENDLDAVVEIRVWDSSAETRYMVLPERPAGTDGMTEAQLAANLDRFARSIDVALTVHERGVAILRNPIAGHIDAR
jgi:hypothetical protein